MLTLIGIFIMSLAEFVFSFSANGGSTNWSIFYFASWYLGVVLVSADLVWKDPSKAIRFSGAAFGAFFIILMILEMSFINVPFDEYIIGVNTTKLRILAGGILAVILIFITGMAWEKRLSKKSEKYY